MKAAQMLAIITVAAIIVGGFWAQWRRLKRRINRTFQDGDHNE
jgi:ABC-type nickel/cobalt efflux system permease component RcnA